MKDFSSLRNTKRARLKGRRLAALVLAIGAGLALAPLARADSGWQWQDASGRMVFSDMPPPPNLPAKNILRRPASTAALITPSAVDAASPAAAGAASAGQAGPAPSLEQSSGSNTALSDAQLRAAVEKRNAEIRQQNCRQAREALSTLASEQPLVTTDAKGEQVLLSNEARAAEIRRLRQVEQDNCKPPAAAQ